MTAKPIFPINCLKGQKGPNLMYEGGRNQIFVREKKWLNILDFSLFIAGTYFSCKLSARSKKGPNVIFEDGRNQISVSFSIFFTVYCVFCGGHY